MKLTWNQTRALENVAAHGVGAKVTPRQIRDPSWGALPYLCGASARSALVALEQKGLVERTSGPPFRYCITPAGRSALSKEPGDG